MGVYHLVVVWAAFVTCSFAEDDQEWPECPSVAVDRESSNPTCDPCSPHVYTVYDNSQNAEIFTKMGNEVKNFNLKGWYRFQVGTGRMLEKCPQKYSCSSNNPIWFNGNLPAVGDGIVDGEYCSHDASGDCCKVSKPARVKNCGDYFVYLLNSPYTNAGAYCVEPLTFPDVCGNEEMFDLVEDTTPRGELLTKTSSTSEPLGSGSGNTNKWFTFTSGKGTIKRSCPGIHHCGFRYPMWIDDDYPVEEGKILMTVAHASTTASNICSITSSSAVYIVKCGDKYYHKLQSTSGLSTYAAYCVDEDIGDICSKAFTLVDDWRGTTIDKARDHCDTNGLQSFDSWYRIGVHNRKMPDVCVAPDKCGADHGYYVGGNGGHPAPEDGIVGRIFYYSSATNCEASSIQGYILNCGDDENGDDFIYNWEKPPACSSGDVAFCAEEDPCSSSVYKKMSEQGRAGRSVSNEKINDINIEHGWYRFTEGEGIMAKSPVLPGHTGITYPGWYDGVYPLEEGQETTGRACFTYNANTCYSPLPVTVRNCRNFHVYHLRTTLSNYGYAYEENVCSEESKTLGGDWRLQYNVGAVAGEDSTLEPGWYEVKLGLRQIASTPTLFKHGGSSRYPGYIEGTHPTEEEGIVERTVYFTKSETSPKGNSKKIYIRNCGSKYLYYLQKLSSGLFYAIGQELCQEGSYEEVDQPHRLYSNPSTSNKDRNNDNKFFHTFTGWYRFMNGNGRVAEWPKIQENWRGGFKYGYQFPEGSHSAVANLGDISEPIPLIQWRSDSQQQYTAHPWSVAIANCGAYFIYKIPPHHSSYTQSGIVIEDEEDAVCEPSRYIETSDRNRLVSSTSTDTGSSDATLEEGWYRLTSGLGYMPTSIFIGTQCSSTYHGHLKNSHPSREEGIVENEVEFRSTSTSVQSRTKIWVKACDGFYLYRLFPAPGNTYRYCEATAGCENARELEGIWRVNSRRIASGKHESSNFGNDGWVYFTQGLGRMPESPPPLNVGGCKWSGYIDSHPTQEEGAVPRVMKFPGVDTIQPIEVENCGDGRYVYFLTKSITNDYCYVADSDVCSEDVYSEVSDVRRLHYSHRHGTAHTRFDLDNKLVGWFRYTVGLGRMMEEPPALTGMCTTEYQGWMNGKHPSVGEGSVSRQICWRYNGEDCSSSNEISVKNCGDFFVYGMAQPPPNNQYGHCIEQDKTGVCESATKLNNPKRGMLTPTVEYVNDQLTITEPGYYRFMSGLGRLTAFEVTEENCGGQKKMLIREILEKDKKNGDARFKLQQFTTSFTGAQYENIGLQCDGYWVYRLNYINVDKLAYCVEEDVCKSNDIKFVYSTNYLQWLKETTENEWDVLSTGWYEVKVGNRKLAYSPSDLNDCSAKYPGYIATDPPSLSDGIVPGQVCYRTQDGAEPSTCRAISMKMCPDKELYYLKKSPGTDYAICVETDVCTHVEGIPLDDSWRLSGTPVDSKGSDKFTVGWYKVTIGNERLAHSRMEAQCGTKSPGWLQLDRHPLAIEGTVNTQVCYDTGDVQPSNCKNAQVVNCGSHYLYHLEPGKADSGVCISSSEDVMCHEYTELNENWRSSEYSATITDHDTSLEPGWYRFTTGLGRMPTVCGEYMHGGGHYPAWASGIDTMPEPEHGVVNFNIYWRHVTNCKWLTARGYVRNCGLFSVYWLPRQSQGLTTYTTEADSCSADQYTELDEERRLAWKQATDPQSDDQLKSGWYRFMNGLQKINEECLPENYGGTWYPGWMDGGHPTEVNEIVERKVFFRSGANCAQASKTIKVKNCGSFYLYRLVPTSVWYGYTVASDVCDLDANTFEQEDRSIFSRDPNVLNDNGLKEGWYQFTTGHRVMAKNAPMKGACRSSTPAWLNGQDPTVGEGTVTRTLCVVKDATACNWQSEIKVRNCGDNKILYYLSSPPYSTARYCVDDSMDNVCNSARGISDTWRGANTPGTGQADYNMASGWIKFTSHAKRMANFPVPPSYCGSTYPLYMLGNHVSKGQCEMREIVKVYSSTNWSWLYGEIYECQCMNGEFIYYHDANNGILKSGGANGVYCVEEEPCENFDRFTGQTRSPWSSTIVNFGDNTLTAGWVKVDTGLRQMPTFVPELNSCGSKYPAWYDGELPDEVGVTTHGRYCFRTSADATCGRELVAQVKRCPGGDLVYHVLPTYSDAHGYCADSEVCDIASEEWGREENDRLRFTSISGFYTSSRKVDSSLEAKWYRISTGLKRMPTECVGYLSCGGEKPGWLNGEHPVPADRVVDRTVCFTTSTTECCGHSQQIKVVACARGDGVEYLYRLYKTPNLYRYCIDEHPDDVCKIPPGSIAHLTDERHGTGHYKDTNFPKDYDLYKVPQWMQINTQSRHFIHYPPVRDFCSTTYPGWIADPAPGPNDGVVESRACFKENSDSDQCYQEAPIKVKNCDGKMLYLYAPPNAAYRNMCVEEDVCQVANHVIYDSETWRLAFTKTSGDYRSDYQKMSTSPYRGWFRFTGTGRNKITEVQQEYKSCGFEYPGYMVDGTHPEPEDGIVRRYVAFTTAVSTYNNKKYEIYVRNCGDFVVYNMDFNWWSAKWGLCADVEVCDAEVGEINEDHRLLNVWGQITSLSDSSLERGWYRFTNGFEKMPETCPIVDSCGSRKPGYLAQPHPGVRDGIVKRKVCFGDADQCCERSQDVLVRNCGTHFVYRLHPTQNTEKYCVEESPNTMCESDQITELEEEWRGENSPEITGHHNDNTAIISGNWYRFLAHTGRMPEYPMSATYSCTVKYPGYLDGSHPEKADGIVNRNVCFSTTLTNSAQSCTMVRVRNCGGYYVYQLMKSSGSNYGYCVAQEPCKDALEISDRWRLIINPYESTQSAPNDNTLPRKWYRFTIGHGTIPQYETDMNFGGQAYPSYVIGDLPSDGDGEVEYIARFGGSSSHQRNIRIKNCEGEYYVYRLEPTQSAQYVYSIDTDVCLHSRKMDEEWRNMFYVSEGEDDIHSDYKKGRDWYHFTTGFQMMAESPPAPKFSCGTVHPAYLNQPHPKESDGVVPREVCYKENEEEIYQACWKVENIRVKNCGDFYSYQLNPLVEDSAYCVYNRKTSCSPKVVHAKYGEVAVVNCTLNSEKSFDSAEVEWTKLNEITLPDPSQGNIDISEDKLLLNIRDIADQNAGVYALFIPSTSTSELVEVVLYSAVEAAQKFYVVEKGGDVLIEASFNVVPDPVPADITWVKAPNKQLGGEKYTLSADKKSLKISGVTEAETGTYKITVTFQVAGKTYTKHAEVIVNIEEEE